MFERFLSFLNRLPDSGAASAVNDPRVAATALLVAVIDADGLRQDSEMEELRTGLSALFGVTGEALDRLVAAGDAAERSAVDFHGFTRVLNPELDDEGRAGFIEVLWEVVYADGDRNELEESVVWRIAELLGVDARARNDIRRKVAAGRSEKGSADA